MHSDPALDLWGTVLRIVTRSGSKLTRPIAGDWVRYKVWVKDAEISVEVEHRIMKVEWPVLFFDSVSRIGVPGERVNEQHSTGTLDFHQQLPIAITSESDEGIEELEMPAGKLRTLRRRYGIGNDGSTITIWHSEKVPMLNVARVDSFSDGKRGGWVATAFGHEPI